MPSSHSQAGSFFWRPWYGGHTLVPATWCSSQLKDKRAPAASNGAREVSGPPRDDHWRPRMCRQIHATTRRLTVNIHNHSVS
jgi:hypothetical protein